MTRRAVPAFVFVLVPALAAPAVLGGDDLPPFEQVSEGYTRVVSTADGSSMWTVWSRERDAQLLAELPTDFEGQRLQWVATVAGGDPELGVSSIYHAEVGIPTLTASWQRRGDRLALIAPDLEYRSTGDPESQAAAERIYTDRVVLSTEIVATGPGGGPVIDLDEVLIGNADEFFGGFTGGADRALARLTKTKAFPNNVEIGVELPRADGRLALLRYSVGRPVQSPGYQTREADRRVGIYYVNFVDRGRHDGRSPVTRYVTRWHLEKADPSLRLSPPRQPIVYYIEHTTPIRYRRWVRDGVLAWNRAFERVGIAGAIEVRQQDKRTGAYMDLDPEDMRYSFVRWTNSDMGYAIGPCNAHPDTGEIYEADIVMDEGFLDAYVGAHLQTELAAAAMSALDPELAPWLADHPSWDPRVRLADPADRPGVAALARALADDPDRFALLSADAPPTMRAEVWDAHRGALGAGAWSCRVQPGLASSVAAARLAVELGLVAPPAGGEGGDGASVLDGMPEEFVGPLLKDVVMHEVGHTLGLMHNWKGSAAHEFAEMNSPAFRGVRPIASTVMDYAPMNIVVEDGTLVQGDLASIDVGSYDLWAIEWAYTFGDPDEVAARATEPGHAFTAEDGAFSPDPQAKTWDLGANSLDYADAKLRFVDHARARFIEVGVRDDDTWQRARELYGMLLGQQVQAISTACHWVGGAYVGKLTKGDEGPDPVRPVEVDRQRRALRLVLDHAFDEEAFGLDPATLRRLGSDNWYDDGYDTAHDWPVHDQVLGVQAWAMTALLNPVRLRRIQDNQLRTDAGQDALTVPEVLTGVREAVWASGDRAGPFTDLNPKVPGLRRNLQSEHADRLIDLATGMRWPGASGHDLRALARQELRTIRAGLADAGDADALTRAHYADLAERIDRALEAAYLRRD